MGIEIVLDEADFPGIRILRGQRLTKQRVLQLRPSGMHLSEPLPRQGFDGSEQGTGPQFFVCIMLLAHLAGLGREWQQGVANQETGPFIKTHDRILGSIGQCVHGQDVFQACQKRGIDLTNTPRMLEVWF